MTEKYLEGQVAIVTGGMRGIGLGIARRLNERGAKIAIWDRETPVWDETAKGFAPGLVIKADVSNVRSVDSAFQETMHRLGRIDILVNNAGINGPVLPAWDYPVEDWEKVIAIDLNGVPPAGIEGIELMDRGADRDGVIGFGALGVGGTKMKIHKAAIARLFEANNLVLDIDELYDIALGLP